jgi:hypothetical protein
VERVAHYDILFWALDILERILRILDRVYHLILYSIKIMYRTDHVAWNLFRNSEVQEGQRGVVSA